MRYDILIDPPSYQVQLTKNNGHITKEKRRFNVSSLISSPKRSHKIPSFRSKTRETLLPKREANLREKTSIPANHIHANETPEHQAIPP